MRRGSALSRGSILHGVVTTIDASCNAIEKIEQWIMDVGIPVSVKDKRWCLYLDDVDHAFKPIQSRRNKTIFLIF